MTYTAKMCYRFVLVLLFMCVFHSKAVIDTSNFDICSVFFYKGKSPQGFEYTKLQTNYEYICQWYNGQIYFATLYMTNYRIPLFSAYRLDEFKCENSQKPRMNQWFIEPQLSYYYSTRRFYEMNTEEYLYWNNFQAVNGDYQFTNYDRGHLNPASYQCDEARTATFTLTNAVPQDPCFNRQKWMAMEQASKKIMKEYCNFQGAQRFFVTGVIPSAVGYNRVNVPAVMWTAACCSYKLVEDYIINEHGLSFSYFGQNKPDSIIEVLSIPELEYKLFNDHVQIFVDGCFSSSPVSGKALDKLRNAIKVMNMNTLASLGIDPLFMKEQINPNN